MTTPLSQSGRAPLARASRALSSALAAVTLGACSLLAATDESRLDPQGPLDGGSDIGTDAECASGCDDGVACTVDSCTDGACANVADDTACGPDERCNPGRGCVPRACRDAADCDDADPCNGTEACSPGDPAADAATGCVAGSAPTCDDGIACTTDSCSAAAGGCEHDPVDGACDDGIACTTDRCDGSSGSDGCAHDPVDSVCDEAWCTIGAHCNAEVGCVGGSVRDCDDSSPCTEDACDEASRSCSHTLFDRDGDGYPLHRLNDGTTCGGTDCNDGSSSVHPGAAEYCNGADDDCDSLVDEGCTTLPEDCASAQALVLDDAGSATATGSLDALRDDYRSRCSASGSGDAVYYVEIDRASDLVIDTTGSAADTVLAVSSSCGSAAFQWACNDDIDDDTTVSRVWVHGVAPSFSSLGRRIYILVDGADASDGSDFSLHVQRTDAAVDSCTAPIDISGGGALLGFVGALATNRAQGSCQEVLGRARAEGIASFRAPPDGKAEFVALSPDFTPDLYVRASPCGTGEELGCERGTSAGGFGGGGSASLSVELDTSERAYVFVDNASDSSTYVLEYTP